MRRSVTKASNGSSSRRLAASLLDDTANVSYPTSLRPSAMVSAIEIWSSTIRMRARSAIAGLRGRGQLNARCRAGLPLPRRNGQCAPVVFHQLVGDGQAEPGALADWLSGEK